MSREEERGGRGEEALTSRGTATVQDVLGEMETPGPGARPRGEGGGNGPRCLLLKRCDLSGGFGFTLRHFIVYPPESYTLLGGQGPMDTIFVKWVRPGSPAAVAGLCTGDRLVAVNGEPTAGRSYSSVVRLIQASPPVLCLTVLPREEDLLQLYFSETAHNPETNQRPHRSSPRLSPLLCVEKDPYMRRADPDGRRGSEDTYSSEDSLILNRLRKSVEQKEEFLRRPLGAPGRTNGSDERVEPSPPLIRWPQAIPASALHPPRGTLTTQNSLSSPSPQQESKTLAQSPGNGISSFGGSGGVLSPQRGISTSGSPVQLTRPATAAPGGGLLLGSPSSAPAGHHQLRMVSERARQFEAGALLRDKTDLYRSELARLSTKRNVPNVADRRKEFESRCELEKIRETHSLDSYSSSHQRSLSPPVSMSLGDRTIPIGGTKLHCEPPREFSQLSYTERKPRERPRSHSVEGVGEKESAHLLSSRHRAVRQDSYLAAVSKPLNDKPRGAACSRLPEVTVTAASPKKKSTAKRPDTLYLARTHRPATAPTGSRSLDSSPSLDPAQRRRKQSQEPVSEDDEKTTRRMSYLKATGGRCNVDLSDVESTSDAEPQLPSPHKRVRKWRPPLFPEDIQRLVRLFESTSPPPSPSHFGSSTTHRAHRVLAIPPKDQEIIIEGTLYCKVILIDGKKAGDRSWRQAWGVLRGSVLLLFRDRRDSTSEVAVEHERLELGAGTVATPADDYTKRRHVFRLSSPSTSELLLQAESHQDMVRWLQALPSESGEPSGGSGGGGSTAGVAPGGSARKGGLRKLTSTFRNRSPTGQSPTTKTRKPSQPEVGVVLASGGSVPGPAPAPAAPAAAAVPAGKSKGTWKGMVAKQLRRIQSSSPTASPISTPLYPDGATIGVPLELCPRSPNNEFVPLLVEHCTRIVEERGLEIIGIYRVSGNMGAVSSLTEAVNRGLEAALRDPDQRWTDVNVISSLLKLFFRNLPDCLLTIELYPLFIEADKIPDPTRRLLRIRNLVKQLPLHHFETLKHLMKHLSLVVQHSCVNKMEARNLAIVFGPTLVRAGDDNMVTMVTDMSHQCRVVESLIQHAEWCFSEEGPESLHLDENAALDSQATSESDASQQSLLLGNVHKLSGRRSEPGRRDIVSSIITAANRKITKSRTRKSLPSSSLAVDDLSLHEKGDKKDLTDGSLTGRGSSVAGAIASRVRGSAFFPPPSSGLHQLTNRDDEGEERRGGAGEEEEEEEGEVEDGSEEPAADGRSQLVTDGLIRTYHGLSETTQERIRKFELETKAMLQRDRNLEWVRSPTQSSPIAGEMKPDRSGGGDTALSEVTAGGGGRGRGHQTAASSPSSGLVSLASLTQSDNSNDNNNNNDESLADLVSTLTDTFDEKLKSLGVLSTGGPTVPPVEEGQRMGDRRHTAAAALGQLSFKDPSLHHSFTSPNLEIKEKEGGFEGKESSKEKLNEKEKEEKETDEGGGEEGTEDDEKENCGGGRGCVGSTGEETEVRSCRLRRSESVRAREGELSSVVRSLRRAESLNKREGRSGGGGSTGGLRRSESLSKTEKTDLNQQRRKQFAVEAGLLSCKSSKMKRKTGGGSERSIKRRHTVGGTKDFDKEGWLDNRQREAAEGRTSSPDLVSALSASPPPLLLATPPQRF